MSMTKDSMCALLTCLCSKLDLATGWLVMAIGLLCNGAWVVVQVGAQGEYTFTIPLLLWGVTSNAATQCTWICCSLLFFLSYSKKFTRLQGHCTVKTAAKIKLERHSMAAKAHHYNAHYACCNLDHKGYGGQGCGSTKSPCCHQCQHTFTCAQVEWLCRKQKATSIRMRQQAC